MKEVFTCKIDTNHPIHVMLGSFWNLFCETENKIKMKNEVVLMKDRRVVEIFRH